MNITEALYIVGAPLGEPSKLPGFSFGISAKDCIVGSKLREVGGSTCSKCYAYRGQYTFPHVWEAHQRRLNGLTHLNWVEAMVCLIEHKFNSHKLKKTHNDKVIGLRVDSRYFRWFDSGDLQSVQMLENIAEVCRRTPSIKHWLATREYEVVKAWFAGGSSRPKNLVIRLSGHMINGPLPTKLAKDLGVNTSGVHTKEWIPKRGIRECPSHSQNNMCMDCRACWNPKIQSISYLKH
jgi:hypothetical protein